ncbi:MAG: hypothetical protein KZQ95_05360 [Candidatus Thiodiazotropha sp. (ex Epidulcina cf. delphinae)]|nr:hypothetical protein [Candidatus Thiodiazotropha sp. (ex Epidulcina cf. delphinae)]
MTLRPYAKTAAYLFGLLALSFFIHQSALSGYWRFDDGWLLDFASRFSPYDYFLNPAITRGYSLNNLTPFNPLVFDFNLGLFGLSPKGFYFQHLTILAGCALASFLLLRLWTPGIFALLGASAFLVGAPSLLVAQQLMVGHYIAGLFFSIIAAYAYLHGIDGRNWRLTALAALFYLLATTCKEIYFPLPFVLLFFQRGDFPTRIYHALPMFAWSACYLLWRFMVLGSFIGGYDAGGQAFSFANALHSYATMPSLLFGEGYRGPAAALALLGLLGYAAIKKRVNMPLLIVTLLAVALPLLPLTNFPGITQPNRYLFLPWWLISITLATTLARLPALATPVRVLIGLIFIVAAGTHGWHERIRMQPKLDRFDATYEFFMAASPEHIFFSDAIKDAYYLNTVLNGARKAQARLDGKIAEQVGIVVHKRSLPLVDTRSHTLWSYDSSCRCIQDITAKASTAQSHHAAEIPNILIVAISPPYPPLFERSEGNSVFTRMSDVTLRIDGESLLPAGDLEHELILVTPRQPKQYKITAHSNPHDSPDLSTFEFRLFLHYPDKAAASLAVNQSCLLIRSALTPLQLLPNSNRPICQGLLSSNR